MAKILIPTPLRQYVGGADSVEVEASNIGDALDKLTTEHADLKKHLFNDEGKLRSFVNVYVNDELHVMFAERTTTIADDVMFAERTTTIGGANNDITASFFVHPSPHEPEFYD